MTIKTVGIDGSAPDANVAIESVGCDSLSVIVPTAGLVTAMDVFTGDDNVMLKFSVPSNIRSSSVGTEIVWVNVVVLAANVRMPLVAVKSTPDVAVPDEVA